MTGSLCLLPYCRGTRSRYSFTLVLCLDTLLAISGIMGTRVTIFHGILDNAEKKSATVKNKKLVKIEFRLDFSLIWGLFIHRIVVFSSLLASLRRQKSVKVNASTRTILKTICSEGYVQVHFLFGDYFGDYFQFGNYFLNK